jgi:hypothetical protein
MHVTEEQLVLHVFGDDDAEAAAHIAACPACLAEVQTFRDVVELAGSVTPPEPADGYGEKVWNSIRWRLGPQRAQKRWVAPMLAAAMLAMAVIGGLLLRPKQQQPLIRPPATFSPQAGRRDSFLRAVVDDHLDDSERVLLEVANADPTRPLDTTSESKRAAELVTSNRIYRQTALQRGDLRTAALLSDLEPLLVEISHSGNSLRADDVASLQRRIDSKGLLFQMRVIRSAKGTNSI